MKLNLAATLERSAANGPGERFVVWVQGCALACPGCHNRRMWSFEPHDVREVDELAAEITRTPGIEGVTFTGGEPFAQAGALAELGRRVREAGLSVFVFSGHDLEELTGEDHRALLEVTDVLVAGRYLEGERTEGVPWRGSANQLVHFLTGRHGLADLTDAPEAEFHLRPHGTSIVTGFPPHTLLAGL